jgi:HD superfamily phosphodiesterase
VTQLERIVALAKQILTVPGENGRNDLWLWEHSERVLRLAGVLASLPEVGEQRPDPLALATAALFHDAGWAVQARQGRIDRWQLLCRPTNEVQRELGAGLMQEQIAHLVPANTLRVAAEAIRRCNHRDTEQPEARVLADADNLDDIGVLNVLRQFRQYQIEGRSLDQLLSSWARQREYRYWDARLNDGFHFQATRELARARLSAVEELMSALSRDHGGLDAQSITKEVSASVPA